MANENENPIEQFDPDDPEAESLPAFFTEDSAYDAAYADQLVGYRGKDAEEFISPGLLKWYTPSESAKLAKQELEGAEEAVLKSARDVQEGMAAFPLMVGMGQRQQAGEVMEQSLTGGAATNPAALAAALEAQGTLGQQMGATAAEGAVQYAAQAAEVAALEQAMLQTRADELAAKRAEMMLNVEDMLDAGEDRGEIAASLQRMGMLAAAEGDMETSAMLAEVAQNIIETGAGVAGGETPADVVFDTDTETTELTCEQLYDLGTHDENCEPIQGPDGA